MSIVQTKVSGQFIRGEITSRSASGLSVQLLHPFPGMAGKRAFPPAESGPRASKGNGPVRENARELLEDLYKIGRYIDRHFEDLAVPFRKAKARIEKIDPLKADRRYQRDWKQIMDKISQGRQGANEYRWQLQSMREAKNTVDDLVQSIKNDFIDEWFSISVPPDLYEAGFAFIDLKNHSLSHSE